MLFPKELISHVTDENCTWEMPGQRLPGSASTTHQLPQNNAGAHMKQAKIGMAFSGAEKGKILLKNVSINIYRFDSTTSEVTQHSVHEPDFFL